MNKNVVLVDYGVGNLLSARRALEHAGANVTQTSSKKDIDNADFLVLPGVGAFGHCMQELRNHGIVEHLRCYSESGRPFLGICVGMQMLMEYSEEFGQHEGLGLIKGSVRKVPKHTPSGIKHKIPHIGWESIYAPQDSTTWSNTPLMATQEHRHFYFLHSYSTIVESPDNLLAECDYNGLLINAVIQIGNTFGLQFHPERSGPDGLEIMKSFLSLSALK